MHGSLPHWSHLIWSRFEAMCLIRSYIVFFCPDPDKCTRGQLLYKVASLSIFILLNISITLYSLAIF